MQIITTRNDVVTYVGNSNTGNVQSLGADAERAAVDALVSHDGRPAWGSDWSEWLDEHAERIVIDATDAMVG